jgi:hypothetical protein
MSSQVGDLVELPRGLVCAANCDSSTASPTLTVLDFACFLSKFQLGSP